MKWTTPILLVAILAVAGFAFRTIFLGTPETPWEVCTRLEQVTKLPGYDKRSALRSLTLSLKHPSARGDEKLTSRLLRLRADIHMEMNAYEKARSDVERMQALLPEESVQLELEAIQLQARTGQSSEALVRVSALAQRHPEAPAVSTLKGRLEAQQGKSETEMARDLTDQYLVKSEAALAYPIIEHLCAQHMEDPHRTRLLRELHKFFNNNKAEGLGRILDTCELASNHFTAARESYTLGLEKELTIPGLAALLDLLVQSGRSDLVVDLGVASRVFPEILRSPGNLIALIDAMELLGQHERIGRVVSTWPWDEASAPREFYIKTSQVLFNADMYSPLRMSAQALRSFTSDDLISADFYAAAISDRGGNYQNSLRMFDRFLTSGSSGPVPAARTIAYRGMAKGWLEQNRPQKALRALQGVIDCKVALEAEDYLALAEAQRASSTILPIIPEENWTRGMVLAPKRVEELTPTWAELGEQTFQSFGQEFDRYYQSIVERRIAEPSLSVGPYTLLRIGKRYLKEERHQSALSIALLLLKKYPDLLPALDLKIESLLQAQSTAHAGPLALMQRLRLVGADAQSQEFLGQYAIERFTREEQLELIRLDPYGQGRARVAQWLFDRGQPGRVLQVLRPIPDHKDPPNLQSLRLQALLATGQYQKTIEESAEWLSHPGIGQLCYRLTIRAQMALQDRVGVAQSLRGLLAKGARYPAERRTLAADLIDNGMLDAAGAILVQMDSKHGWRTPQVLEQLGLCASAAGNSALAEDTLTRAVPFFEDGRIELIQLILAAGDRDWPSLPLRIQRLDESEFAATPFQATGIALLGERVRMGTELAQRGLDLHPNSLAWALLSAAAQTLNNAPAHFEPQFGPEAENQARALLMGSGDVRRDPRDTIALLLALELSPWQTWTEIRAQAALADAPQNLWLDWLQAEAQFRSGRLEAARTSYSALIQRFPLCAPLWNQLFAVLGALHPDDPLHPDLLAAHADQVLASSLREFMTAEQVTLGLASQASSQGHPDQAINTLQRFLKESPDPLEPEIRWMLGRLLAEQMRFKEALDQFDKVLLMSKVRGLHPWIPEYLHWVEIASNQSTEPVSAKEMASRLEALMYRYPSDPQLSLQRLTYRVESDERSILMASDEALASLEMLRTSAPANSIEALRAGSDRLWMEYILSISPILGEKYCQDALDVNPGNLDMWIGLSYALSKQGRVVETRELVGDLLMISDDPELHFRLASLLALEGASPESVQLHLQRGDELLGRTESSPRSRFTQAQSTLLHGARSLDEVVRELGDLWERREENARAIPPLELGRVYLTSLILRHTGEDLGVVGPLCDEMLFYKNQDPYAEDLIRAFRAVGHAIEARLLVDSAESSEPN